MTADLLKVTSPEAWQEARAQIGEYLKRAAFGENGAGDKAIAPERFQQAIRALGSERLGAFHIKKLQNYSGLGGSPPIQDRLPRKPWFSKTLTWFGRQT